MNRIENTRKPADRPAANGSHGLSQPSKSVTFLAVRTKSLFKAIALMGSLHWRYRHRLEPFANKILEIEWMITEMSDEQLIDLAAACGRTDSVNCGWNLREASLLIEPKIRGEQDRRKRGGNHA